VAQGQRSGPDGPMPTLRKWIGYDRSQGCPNRVRVERTRKVRELRAEKPHPNAGGGDIAGRLRCGAERDLQSSMQTSAASGN
jgi:hypothetical protein